MVLSSMMASDGDGPSMAPVALQIRKHGWMPSTRAWHKSQGPLRVCTVLSHKILAGASSLAPIVSTSPAGRTRTWLCLNHWLSRRGYFCAYPGSVFHLRVVFQISYVFFRYTRPYGVVSSPWLS